MPARPRANSTTVEGSGTTPTESNAASPIKAWARAEGCNSSEKRDEAQASPAENVKPAHALVTFVMP